MPDYSSYTPPPPPQLGPQQYYGPPNPPPRHKMVMSDLPWPVRIIVAIVGFILISWFLSTQVFHTGNSAPKGQPCMMLFDQNTGQQLNPDCKPVP
jgi:hypothetical protein